MLLVQEARQLNERVYQDCPHPKQYIPTTMQVGIDQLEVLQLGVDGSELLSQKSAFCCFERDLSIARAFGKGKQLRHHTYGMQ